MRIGWRNAGEKLASTKRDYWPSKLGGRAHECCTQ
ncbi:unnamed protein product [Amoebophrya sp. A25]|nr:unnamed protein product [Amoebophrya sp. A25]|eukprot:GSA25T00008729001.1